MAISYKIVLFLLCAVPIQQAHAQIDTVFLVKDNTTGQRVFIDEREDSPWRHDITTEDGDHFFPVYLYKECFYLYKPCDFIFHYYYHFSRDSFWVERTEPIRYSILSTKAKKNGLMIFKVKSVEIHAGIWMVMKQKGMPGLFEFTFKRADTIVDKQLMANRKLANKLPIIVNFCPDEKVSEFDFQKPHR